jgi:hypothetical protein
VPRPLDLRERIVIVDALLIERMNLKPDDPFIVLKSDRDIANDIFDEGRLVVSLPSSRDARLVFSAADTGVRTLKTPHIPLILQSTRVRVSCLRLDDSVPRRLRNRVDYALHIR